ncbi:ABC transporter permease [Amycolatopsis rubida]|uniref:ABC transporter permease n=1 Tax=Amycolatopsis rubida TaxID=112413 RepID=A0ABX0BQR9_9PSEU|nr:MULTISPECIES: YhgE/Pip domain-containing protein [Amycolatopsis]MYW92949.1 ABC transporter permease [Amycolatopsis rubida]NEC57936.1 ABC transporter permease [Amycolatopsis rubida]OAP25473.1 ABC-2 family transporter protein [Amycolatopsis sp. M39]
MKAVRLAVLELRRFRGSPLRRLVPVVLCLVPLLYGAMYLWANWDPYGKLSSIPVAVVNEDRPAQGPQGEPIDAGTQLVQQLKAAGTFDWHFVDSGEARAGLTDGRYYFTITVPPDFSGKLATAANTRPEQAAIGIQLNDANNYVVGIMTEVVQPELQDQINAAAHAAYVRSIYGELSEVRDKLTTASDGAHRLVDATAVGQQAATALVSGTGTLRQGTAQISGGADRVSQAVHTLGGQARKLGQVVSDQLPAAAATLSGVTSGTARGLATAHTGTSQISQYTQRGTADLTQLADTFPQLRGDPAYQRALADAHQLTDAAARVDGDTAAADHTAQQAFQQAQALQANVGTAQQNITALSGSTTLLDDGAHDISAGTRTLTAGMTTLNKGATTAQTAAGQAHSGAADLSGVVDDSLKRIPQTNPAQIAHAAEVLGNPVHVDRHNLNPAGVYGRGFAPFFFGIALWVFGLFAYLLLRPLNKRALASRVSAATVAVAGWLPGAVLGCAGALVLYAVVDFGLGLDPVHPLLTVLLLLVGAASFVAIDHCLRTALGAPGDVLSLVLLILQLTSSGGLYPMPTTPGFFQLLNPLLPMTYLVDGLRVTVSGGLSTHLVRDFAVLAGFAVVALACTSFAVNRQRRWTVARLHPEVEL